MSKSKIRNNKTCLNCNYVVENRFCGNCGQENIDTRKSFFQLFFHFFEDLTHYENAFWRTIKNLIFNPASLTKEYLSGRRMSYLAPVRLYIFISFITFFLMSILPDDGNKENNNVKINNHKKNEKLVKDTIYAEQEKIIEFEKKGLITKKESDSLLKFIIKAKNKKEDADYIKFSKKYKNVKELDSIQKFSKPSEKMNAIHFWAERKIQIINDKYTGKEIEEKFIESFVHNIPKALFVYMPLFAFILWLFQNKKRWYYFDHGIFTLHYFSFLLLGTLLLKILRCIFYLLDDYIFFMILNQLFTFIIIVYMFYYFFPSHHRFYQEKRWISILKGIAIFFINFFIISFILVCFAMYSFITIH
ncbi:MAG: DUF3667 domain-containing protein [Flavobacterium sp.]|nr:DUF3667 domain-containing protein [Flavobacterium sp.]